MKIAISSTGKDLESNVDAVFGRCPYFIIVEIDDKHVTGFEAIENKSMNQMGGAGISAAEEVMKKNVNAVISENVGPRALDVFRQFKIDVYKGNGSIKDVLQEFMEGKLSRI